MLKYLISFCSIAILAIIISGCSKKSEQELWTTAQKNVQDSLYKDAVNNFTMLVKDYPQSQNAPKALFEVAKMYQGKVIKDVNPDESMKHGISFYRRVYTEYPKSEEAPKSLFMIGFIQSNELRQFDSATVSYKLFISKYPENEMAASAQAELDNMGLTPQEIIKKNQEAKK
ncbi:MAG: tetratricopeptide repeat protein [Syntrophothermus sp.]